MEGHVNTVNDLSHEKKKRVIMSKVVFKIQIKILECESQCKPVFSCMYLCSFGRVRHVPLIDSKYKSGTVTSGPVSLCGPHFLIGWI
jgi:hypothetical protein